MALMHNTDNNVNILLWLIPSNFVDDDVGAVMGRRVGVVVGRLPSVGLATGRRVGLSSVAVGPDTGLPDGASIVVVGDFVGLIVVGAIG